MCRQQASQRTVLTCERDAERGRKQACKCSREINPELASVGSNRGGQGKAVRGRRAEETKGELLLLHRGKSRPGGVFKTRRPALTHLHFESLGREDLLDL